MNKERGGVVEDGGRLREGVIKECNKSFRAIYDRQSPWSWHRGNAFGG